MPDAPDAYMLLAHAMTLLAGPHSLSRKKPTPGQLAYELYVLMDDSASHHPEWREFAPDQQERLARTLVPLMVEACQPRPQDDEDD